MSHDCKGVGEKTCYAANRTDARPSWQIITAGVSFAIEMLCGRQQQHRQEPRGLGLGLSARQKGLSVGFDTGAALVNELLEPRDERQLLRLQCQIAILPVYRRVDPC